MSELSYLEKLLDGVEVEWLPLGNVAEIYGGLTGKSKSDFENGNARYVSYKKIFGYLDVHDYPTDYVYISEGERQNKVRYGDVLFTGSSEIADEAGMSSAVTVHFDESVYLNSFSFGIRFSNSIKIKPEFAKYLFRTHFMRSEIAKTASGVTRFNISKSRFKKILVPIICPNDPEKSLAIQSEIVRILDKFTALTAELTAELNMRKKQYNYYRDQLLSFEEGEVEWRTLGEIGEVRMCKRILKSQTSSEGEIPFYKIGTFGKEPDSYISRKLFNEFKEKYSYPKVGEVLISASGTIGRTVIFDGRESYFQDSNIVWIENNEKIVLNKYLFYFYKIAKWGISEGGTIKRLYNDNLRKLMIPVPFPDSPERSLVEQQKIVKLLDKFDALTNSITEGLPREIELRQKQYEYYRDLLFSFPKPDSVTN
ncbi:restriction endonuclease subunit S [Leclercia adecarboxylata]|uniref:restriction endonuclease subunit S n=1 Tax=Leclercia TaxID=83654 RepID=UPI000CDBDABB|nr:MULTISPECIES: restriction endonuclease subunit S [Leclercia]AUY41633.1 restriction endonuclease subunit S [Leclercia sp. LSNIH3]MDQ2131479.1 restriction endonuclease subunit S [Leclercia adecarboxylata]MDV7060077.1 restriction endonuclease subunit S [Leclercia adecarboxylata]POW66408.1 restriction endonuclease subunit S [Leclercia sp. LSNIH4]